MINLTNFLSFCAKFKCMLEQNHWHPILTFNSLFFLFQQIQSGSIHQSRQTPLSSATSSSLPLSDTSLPPLLDLSSQQAEANGNTNLCLAQNSSTTTQDSPSPIPEGKNSTLHKLNRLKPKYFCWHIGIQNGIIVKQLHYLAEICSAVS